MVSWNDGETSTESLYSEPEGPVTIYDSDFCGLNEDDQRRCDCHEILEKFVAFESSDTGRRFLECSCVDGLRCGTVEWIDNEWPMSLKKALWALWEKYEEEKDGRRREALETSFKIFSLGKDKEELEKMVHTLQCELQKLEKEKQVQEVPERLLNVEKLLTDEKVLRLKAEKERDDLKEEKKKQTNVMEDLFKALQVNKEKLKKISVVLSE